MSCGLDCSLFKIMFMYTVFSVLLIALLSSSSVATSKNQGNSWIAAAVRRCFCASQESRAEGNGENTMHHLQVGNSQQTPLEKHPCVGSQIKQPRQVLDENTQVHERREHA
eukprot:1488360-Amphidinium_carterae.1